MGQVDHERLSRLLGTAELAWVIDRARRRMERGEPLDGTVTLASASAGERDALARLLGRQPRTARGLSVSLGDLDALLRRAGLHDGGLAGAVITLSGPVTVRAQAQSAQALAWAQAFAGLEAAIAARTGAAGGAELAEWLAHVRSSGLIKRLAGGSPATGARLLAGLALVLEALPCQRPESLPAFAARVLGRAHALDDGAPLSTLALGAARALAGIAAPGLGESPSEARREAWAAVGVLCDELSSVVLTLGLPGDGTESGGPLAAAHAAGEPLWLTLRQLVRSPPTWRGLQRVLIVENPSVVAFAADRFAPASVPLVCTHGQPRAATMVLLRSLAAAGVQLVHHGDFDWPGITIANLLQRRLPLKPWQFGADAYREAVLAHRHTASLVGAPVLASWDRELTATMAATGRQVEEELVAQDLLDSLEGASNEAPGGPAGGHPSSGDGEPPWPARLAPAW
ncbi:TIGR02679 family protein [Conexibacter sp. S30A1]|uniref:TIGR02679 family protein n=1 Tax=Conexibacter sp. S30A1 TaxID=2937800 RepID=UPI0035308BE7